MNNTHKAIKLAVYSLLMDSLGCGLYYTRDYSTFPNEDISLESMFVNDPRTMTDKQKEEYLKKAAEKYKLDYETVEGIFCLGEKYDLRLEDAVPLYQESLRSKAPLEQAIDHYKIYLLNRFETAEPEDQFRANQKLMRFAQQSMSWSFYRHINPRKNFLPQKIPQRRK
jgi:hypothetical protein